MFCFDRATGGPTNVMHTVLVTAGPRASQLGAYVHAHFGGATTPVVTPSFTTGATPTVTRTAAGKYTVTFPGIAPRGEVAIALSTQLNVSEWHSCTHFVTSTTPLTIDVACFNRQGVLSESWGFGLLILQ